MIELNEAADVRSTSPKQSTHMTIEEYLNELVNYQSLIIHQRKKLAAKICEPFNGSDWINLAYKVLLYCDSNVLDENESVRIYNKCQKYLYSKNYTKANIIEISLWVLSHWKEYTNAISPNPVPNFNYWFQET